MCAGLLRCPVIVPSNTHRQPVGRRGGLLAVKLTVCQLWVHFMSYFAAFSFNVSIACLLLLFAGACRTKKTWPVSFPEEELRKRLSPMQYHVTQERGTESAFTGEFAHHKDEGTYTCVVCGAPLFSSNTKFDSGSGWPSFFDLLKDESITQSDDFSYGMHRVETTCSQCGAHLGHLFDDGPKPTGKRYCINSASLAFQPEHVASSSTSNPVAEGGAASSSVSDGKTEL